MTLGAMAVVGGICVAMVVFTILIHRLCSRQQLGYWYNRTGNVPALGAYIWFWFRERRTT